MTGPERAASSVSADPHGALQAVLFDMDGTLVDTEPYWITAEYDLVARFGGSWSDELAHAQVGNPLVVTGASLREHGGVPLDPAEIVERLLDDVLAATGRHVPWRPGALELLGELRAASVPCALVTMSYTRLAAVVIDALPPGTFASVVTGDRVHRGKPDPEAYLTAAAELGADPTRCVAIEDSPTGLAAAEAAGCIAVGVPHRVPIPPRRGRVLLPGLDALDLPALEHLAAVRDGAADTAGRG